MARARLGDYLALSPAWRWLSKHLRDALGPARQLREQSSWVFLSRFGSGWSVPCVPIHLTLSQTKRDFDLKID